MPERDCDLLRDLLIAEGVIADAAFVDGSHRFHEVLVDPSFEPPFEEFHPF